MFEEQSFTRSIGSAGFAPTTDLPELLPRYGEAVRMAIASAQEHPQIEVDGDDSNRIFSPFTSNFSSSPPLNEDRSLIDDLQEKKGILKSDAPFTDSGYRSAPNLDHFPYPQLMLEKSPRQSDVDSSAIEGSRADEDARTTYSIGTTVDPGYARKYIIELCNDIHSKLLQSGNGIDKSRLPKILPELIRAFALKLYHDAPSQTSQINHEIMYFIHKRHK